MKNFFELFSFCDCENLDLPQDGRDDVRYSAFWPICERLAQNHHTSCPWSRRDSLSWSLDRWLFSLLSQNQLLCVCIHPNDPCTPNERQSPKSTANLRCAFQTLALQFHFYTFQTPRSMHQNHQYYATVLDPRFYNGEFSDPLTIKRCSQSPGHLCKINQNATGFSIRAMWCIFMSLITLTLKWIIHRIGKWMLQCDQLISKHFPSWNSTRYYHPIEMHDEIDNIRREKPQWTWDNIVVAIASAFCQKKNVSFDQVSFFGLWNVSATFQNAKSAKLNCKPFFYWRTKLSDLQKYFQYFIFLSKIYNLLIDQIWIHIFKFFD